MDNESQRIRNNLKSLAYKKRNVQAVVETRWRNKMRLIQYKGGKCERCGYNKPIANVYHFHHTKIETKSFTIARCMSNSFESLKAEADKCVLLCSNCHAELHDQEYANARKQTIKTWQEWNIEEVSRRKRKAKLTKKCQQCENDFYTKHASQKFCSTTCRIESQRKVICPSPEELREQISKYNWCQIGRKFGVSDNAVRKWARKYGIEFTKRKCQP